MLPEELNQLPREVMLRGLKSRAKCKERIKLGHSAAGASQCNAPTGLLEPSARFKPAKIVRKSAKRLLTVLVTSSNSQALSDVTFSDRFNACA